ncbi:RING/U-box superfamily protein isoform 3 [Hibiscus syriacus]|uniref:RING/U-box superfamily protein isoform 3 n=1 Tax=Hibiscus syriacus TaxID=106335 RepID=A0A6A2Y727_HIBSY|nr:RING/U-box superfamily protein isoform 3 [Hibiscus syriacus]
MTTSFYKFGLYDSDNISYCDHGHSYEVNNQELCADEYRRASESSSLASNEQIAAVTMESEGNANTTSPENPVDCVRIAHKTPIRKALFDAHALHMSYAPCPWRPHHVHDYQVIWQDSVEPDNMTPDNMTYEVRAKLSPFFFLA